MNITLTLKEFFEDEYPSELRDCKNKILNFIDSNTSNKYDLSLKLIKNLVEPPSKQDLVKQIVELYKVESATMVLTGKRDHAIHALNTFLLGVFINNKYLDNKVNMFQWKMTALFHDIAYPLEISQEIIERYFKELRKIKDNLHIENFNPTLKLIPKNFEKLTNNKNSFDYIQKRIYEWGLDVNIQKRYTGMISSNRVCHGMISALTVLYLVDLMYQKNNPERDDKSHEGWEQRNFEKDIVSSCSAIYLHNLRPTDFFKGCKNKSKLAYLLKLSDELQEWDRPNNENPEGDSSHKYDIKISGNKLIFASKNEEQLNKIQKNIMCLGDSNIKIVKGFGEEKQYLKLMEVK